VSLRERTTTASVKGLWSGNEKGLKTEGYIFLKLKIVDHNFKMTYILFPDEIKQVKNNSCLNTEVYKIIFLSTTAPHSKALHDICNRDSNPSQ